MWQRFKRAMRSFAGFFISSVEDPELILEQNVRDLNDQVPKMNESIAMVRANVTLLEKENAKYKTEVGELTAKEKALNVKKMFMREKDKKTQEAMNAIRDARRAKWQAKVADAMESFQVAGIDATHGEMLRKV